MSNGYSDDCTNMLDLNSVFVYCMLHYYLTI